MFASGWSPKKHEAFIRIDEKHRKSTLRIRLHLWRASHVFHTTGSHDMTKQIWVVYVRSKKLMNNLLILIVLYFHKQILPFTLYK